MAIKNDEVAMLVRCAIDGNMKKFRQAVKDIISNCRQKNKIAIANTLEQILEESPICNRNDLKMLSNKMLSSSFDKEEIAIVIVRFSRDHELDFEIPANVIAERILFAKKNHVTFYDIIKFCVDVMRKNQEEGRFADIQAAYHGISI